MGVRRWMAGAAVAAAVLVPVAPAFAQNYGGTTETTVTTAPTTTSTTEVEETTTTTEDITGVSGVTVTVPPTDDTEVEGRVLARTGSEILRGVAIGGTLVGLGAIFVAGTRRRRTATA